MSSPLIAEQLLALIDGFRLRTLIASESVSVDAFDHAVSVMRRNPEPPASRLPMSSQTEASAAPVTQQGQA